MIRCMIIDSDHASRRTLSRELAKDDTFSVTGMYDYPSEVPFPVNRKTVDVLFIEAVFRGESGLDFVRSLRNPPLVVITTAYRDYAVECFELDILDYLVKPVEQARFSRTLSKIERILSSAHDAVRFCGSDSFRNGEALTRRSDYGTSRSQRMSDAGRGAGTSGDGGAVLKKRRAWLLVCTDRPPTAENGAGSAGAADVMIGGALHEQCLQGILR
mgnify:CR=1 FL=1